MKIKTQDLIGVTLDWAVATCEGIDVVAWVTKDKRTFFVVLKEFFIDMLPTTFYTDPESTYYPSTNWNQCGAIMDREEISVNRDNEPTYMWAAWTPAPLRDESEAFGYGNTQLIAACRCYVASVLGDEVDVPDDLLEWQNKPDGETSS